MNTDKLSKANYLNERIRCEEKTLEEIVRAGFEATMLTNEEETFLCDGKQRFRFERINIFISQDYIFEQIEIMEKKQRNLIYDLKKEFNEL